MANVPQEYESYINTINGSGFNFKNYPIQYGTSVAQPIVETDIENMSWVVGKNYARWDQVYPSTPITVKLSGDTTHITVTYEGYSNSAYTKCNDYYRIMYYDKSYDSQSPQNILLGSNVYSAYYGMNYYSVSNFTTEFAINNADNIQQALLYLTSRFKNIIIYVNDVKWSDPFTPTTATVKVTCNIPKEPDYKYIKLTYKKDTRPDSWEDGSSIDITKNAVTIDIPGLDIGSNYWFTIFTDINESESFPFGIDTVEDPVPPEIKPYIEWINGSGNLFKKLTYNQNSINSYTYQGATYYHKISIDPKQTSFLQKIYAMDYDTSDTSKWGIENYTYQGYTGMYYNRASAVNQLLTLEINSAETEGLYTLSIPQLTMSYLTSTDMVPDLLITQNGEFYKISGTTSGYDTQRSKTVTSNLEGIFKFIWHHFHNVNIKVNGTYWSKVN